MPMPSKKFVVSFSGGKDCVLALYRAVKNGNQPLGLLTTYDEEHACSWFHRVPEPTLRQVSESLDIPLRIVKTHGNQYITDFEWALENFKSQDAGMVVFGDIDIPEHYEWSHARCENVGMESMFPLWKKNRIQVVEELIDVGFKAIITSVDCSRMHERYLGKTLTRDIVSQLVGDGVDACGENGEYHTFVYDGPLFRWPIRFATDRPVKTEHHVYLPLIQNDELKK